MKFLDLTLDTPAANLAGDEALLEVVEEGAPEAPAGVLRFYESPVPFVVVGYGNRIGTEVDVEACAAEGIPILRRSSGGGTVVLGPGCLAYALVLPVAWAPELATVSGTNRFVMERHRSALAGLLGRAVEVRGHTDLALGDLKFSGNAQRRRRRALLFHGTLLLNFDVGCLGRWLRPPSAEPEYRAGRAHGTFVTNLGIGATAAKAALRRAWSAEEEWQGNLGARVTRLMGERYGCAEWHERWA
jgi:lipoate-protein ligase A